MSGHGRVRLEGAALALVPGVLFVFLSRVGPPAPITDAIAIASLPVGGVLGALFAPSAVRADSSPVRVALGFSALAVLLGAVVVAATLSTTSEPSSSTKLLNLVTFGLLFFGLPTFLVALAAAFLWVTGMRTLHRSRGVERGI